MKLPSVRVALSSLGILVAVALVIAAQNYLNVAVNAPDRGPSFRDLIFHELTVWIPWWPLLPLIQGFQQRMRHLGTLRLLAGHAVVSFLCILYWVLVLVTFRHYVWSIRPPRGDYWSQFEPTLVGSAAALMLMYAVIAAVLESLDLQREARRRAVRESSLRADLAEARLESLQARLQPHFLFNTLNAVSGLMGRDVPAARTALTKLSDLLRSVLEDGPDEPEVTLAEELELLDRYVALLRLRFGERLRLEVDVPAELKKQAWVPRLLLQPLVENAITHGVEKSRRAGEIRVVARAVGEFLSLKVADDGPGPPPNPREGIGLGNTRARLDTLYDGRASLELRAGEDGGAVVEARIPLEMS